MVQRKRLKNYTIFFDIRQQKTIRADRSKRISKAVRSRSENRNTADAPRLFEEASGSEFDNDRMLLT